MAKVFDEKTQKWIDVPETNTPSASSENPSTNPTNPTVNTGGTTQPHSTPVTTSKDEGVATQANKNFTDAELTYLTGDANVQPNSVTLATQAGNTVELKNLGRHLSGLYFVTEIKTNISTSGVTLTYSVLKNGFGDTLKPYVPIAETSEQTETPIEVIPTLSVGDKVRFIEGVDAVYANTSDGVSVPAWVKTISHTVQQLSDDGQRALLKEIVSWTYVKYLQKE